MESKIEEIKLYYDNGQISHYGFTKNGEIDGEYKVWDENGQIIKMKN